MTTIRPATRTDLPAIARLAMLHGGGGHAHWQARFAGDLTRPDTCLLVAGDHGHITGYGRALRFAPPPAAPPSLAPAGYYLAGLVVHPDHRGQGTGEQITRARMAWAATRAPEIWYFTNATNYPSQRLHRRLGFSEITRDFTYPGVTFTGGTGILYRALLAPGPA